MTAQQAGATNGAGRNQATPAGPGRGQATEFGAGRNQATAAGPGRGQATELGAGRNQATARKQAGAAPRNRSPQDHAVRAWRRCAGGDAVLLDGFHAVKHAVRFGAELLVALTVDLAGTLALADQLAPDVRPALAAQLVELPAERIGSLVPRLHPTGVAALAVRPSPAAQRDALAHRPRTAPVVVLDQPRHLGNAGAVVRLAAGCGATGVITTGPLDPWHPAVVRGGAGLHFATAVARMDVAGLPQGPILALDAEGDDIRGMVIPDDALLAFGSERSGLSAELRARADHVISLPMRPQVSSYNLATSVAMVLYHWSLHSTGSGDQSTEGHSVGGHPTGGDFTADQSTGGHPTSGHPDADS